MTYRIAIAGCGGIADRHLAAIKRMEETNGRARAVAVADTAQERAQAAADRYGGNAAVYVDYKQMIRETKPDIVVIALPHFLHLEAACFAAEAGCHVLLEKPMALTVSECDLIIGTVKRNRVRLLVGHTQRYIRENLAAKRLIEEGALGELVMAHDVRHTDYYANGRPDWFFRKELSGGGIAFNLGSHSIDKIMWLAGSQASSVAGSLSHHGGRGDAEGSMIAYLRLQNNLPATIVQSGYKGAPAHYTELIFTKGMLRLETGRGLQISRGGPYEPLELPESADPFLLQLEDLMQYIETGRPPACTMEYSRHVIEVLEALSRSHLSGQEELVSGLMDLPSTDQEQIVVPKTTRPDGEAGSRTAIRHYLWMQTDYRPKVTFALSYTEEELRLVFRVYEEAPLIRYTRPNDPVYRDSCVEFFLQPAPAEDARYLNFEMNAAGTLLVGLGKGRQDRLYLGPSDRPVVPVETAAGLRDPDTGELYWTARLRIPLGWLSSLFPSFVPRTGAAMRGNFYKCGDETQVPHYGCWSQVRSDVPDFHRSEDFGTLVLG
ncbi:carbohydrate-binding family 9-like protein [Cohnella zeiphila]|uniref:Gfo/Idh/MocA family oxidoreductase n=1 Tax=Cohnella zeiphila TaxID=2761120 RepID=A0A7X0SM17_9BACL|nr:carbohydrate-binding family 9-like protein [Cohnella zeiphila]MBB6732421.1 Gfo/Idh/MocA family oxidoreductase [Cohnella zeiphila]